MPETPEKSAKPLSAKPCPICRKPASEKNKPFCSARCADVDLNRWLSGNYVIPGRDLTEDDEAEAAPPPRKKYDLGGD